MFISDMPNVPPQSVPVMVAQASVTTKNIDKFDRVIAICHLAQNPPVPVTSAVNVIEPVMESEDYLTKWEHKKVEGIFNSSIFQQPAHGLLMDEGNGAYVYVPETGYLGKDQGTLLVMISSLKVKVIYFFQVLNSLPTDTDQENYCPKYKWRITQLVSTFNDTSLARVVMNGLTLYSRGTR